MIFADRTITVKKGTSSIDDIIILYRGDKEVEIRFTLNESSPFKFGSGANSNIIEKTEAAYGQLVIKTPNGLPAIFSKAVPTYEGKVVFKITGEMINEITEVGYYTFQIRLFDESMNSRASLPEVVDGIEIREPIASEDNTNKVGVATVGYALTTAAANEDAFDTEGNYNKTTWRTGDRITASKLNKIEAGIEGTGSQIKENSNNISNIKSQVDSTNNGSPKGCYPTVNDLTAAFPNGDKYIYVVSEDGGWYYWKDTQWLKGGTYQSTIIEDKSVQPRHISFIEHANLFNKNDILLNGYYNQNTFEWVDLEGVSQTGDIECKPGDVVYFIARSSSDSYKAVFKDSLKNIIAGTYIDHNNSHQGLIFKFTVPSDAKYFTLMFYNNQIDEFMITINEPNLYEYMGKGNVSPIIRIDEDNIINKCIDKKHMKCKTISDYITDYNEGTINVFNKNDILPNGYYNQNTFQWVDLEGVSQTGDIECKPGDVVYFIARSSSDSYKAVFKDATKTIIAGTFIDYNNTHSGLIFKFTVPSDAKYFTLMFYNNQIDEFMITINEPCPYEYVPFTYDKIEFNDNFAEAIRKIIKNEKDKIEEDEEDAYLENRVLVWEDDFSGVEIDRTSWMNLCRKDGSGNNQLEYNTARNKNCRVENGKLIIEARREHYRGFNWTSANLNTSDLHEFMYGRIEAKIKLPNAHGIWPAFWTLGANANLETDERDEFKYMAGEWPECGEIDILEYWGRNAGGTLGGALHYATDTNNTHGSHSYYQVQEGDDYDPAQWHIYGIEWTEEKIDFMLDGITKATVPLDQFTLSNGFNPFRHPHYLILNVTVDVANEYMTPKNNKMFVDWIRVYAPENESYVNPTGLALNVSTVNLNVGDERVRALETSITPSNSSEQTIIWESSNEDIVLVRNGYLTAKKQGTCEITARTINGYEAKCTVTVN